MLAYQSNLPCTPRCVLLTLGARPRRRIGETRHRLHGHWYDSARVRVSHAGYAHALAQVDLIGPVGEPVFRTTKAMFDDFLQWVADDASEVACDEVITHARVKAILDTLYSDQLHRGDRNGLQHKKGPGNHDLWNFTDIDPSRPVGSDGARFEREIVKRVFAMLDTTCDVVTISGELTPAQRVGLQPSSVTQIAYALADLCAGAPDFVTLCTVARDVITAELQRRNAKETGHDIAQSASSGRAGKKQR